MLLCCPTIHAVNYETHEVGSLERSMMSGNSGGTIPMSNQRIRGYLHQGRPGRSSFDHHHRLQQNNQSSPPISMILSQQITSPTASIPSHSGHSLVSSASIHQSPVALDANTNPHDHELWQTNATTYHSSPEEQLAILPVLPLSTQELTTPIVTSSWSPQDALETAGWHDVTGLDAFAITAPSEPGFTDWSVMDSTTSWQAPMTLTAITPISTAPPPINAFTSDLNPTPTTPYRHDSFFAYKPLANAGLPTYADMEITAEIPYPNVYIGALQALSPRVHPAFLDNVGDVQALQHSVLHSFSTSIEDSLLSSIETKQALATALPKSKSSHTHSHGGVTKTKIIPKGGRVGPLTVSQREKVEDMRTYGACWRCRKYKKPCNGPGICNTCQTSGFRVWPSALGCRRGDFDSFAFGMIPTHSEQIVGQMTVSWDKPASWRRLAKVYRSELILPPSTMQGDRFEALMYKVQRSQLTGPGVMELLQIACNLQRGLTKESRVLANTLKGLAHACDFYGCFVSTEDGSLLLPGRFDLVNIFTQNRKALLTTLSSFLNSCLTGRMKDWLPTFLSANFIVYTFVMLSDAAVMVPPQFRDKLWASIKAIIMDFRHILYPMAQDLLSALGKGSKLLHMQCWTMIEKPSEDPDGQPILERNSEGMKILDNDIAIFDGLRALQLWLEKFGPLMRRDAWYSAEPHTQDVLPICSWERMFDFSPRG